jgi:hypothetical protein
VEAGVVVAPEDLRPTEVGELVRELTGGREQVGVVAGAVGLEPVTILACLPRIALHNPATNGRSGGLRGCAGWFADGSDANRDARGAVAVTHNDARDVRTQF